MKVQSLSGEQHSHVQFPRIGYLVPETRYAMFSHMMQMSVGYIRSYIKDGLSLSGSTQRTFSSTSDFLNFFEEKSSRMQKMNRAIRNEIVAIAGEYIGTTSFLGFGFAAAQIANLPGASTPTADGVPFIDVTHLLFIATAFGLSLLVNAWVFYRVSGSIFNPAVTLALVTLGAVPPLRGALVVVAQVLGGMTAAALVDVLTPGPLLVATLLGGGVNIARGLFIEMFLTTLLVLTILMLAVEKHKATYVAPVGIGLALFICHLAGIYFTGASMNPARSFGPQVIIRDFPGYHWIYWLGPSLGAMLAAAIYKILKFLEYEQNNGSQDRDETMLIAQIMQNVGEMGSSQHVALKNGQLIVAEIQNKEDDSAREVSA